MTAPADAAPCYRGPRYTTRLQKGGALLDTMRALTLAWNGEEAGKELATQALAFQSRRRMHDVIVRTFQPRFVDSSPPDLWRVAAALERAGADRSCIVPLHYYAAASAEPLLWDFVVKELYPRAGTETAIGTQDVLRFLEGQPDEAFGGRRWTATVATKVSRGLLAALRDFGVLTGIGKKRIAGPYLPVGGFALLARIRHELGYRGTGAVHDDVWKLFFLDEQAVARYFIEADSLHVLRFEAAGLVMRIDYPEMTLEDYARAIAHRTAQRA